MQGPELATLRISGVGRTGGVIATVTLGIEGHPPRCDPVMGAYWFTKAQMRRMLANGRKAAAGRHLDPHPVVRLYLPDGAATYLLASLDPADPTQAYGLCDTGQGTPTLGMVDLVALRRVRGYLKLPVSRDLSFHPDRPLSAYTAEAIAAGRIIV